MALLEMSVTELTDFMCWRLSAAVTIDGLALTAKAIKMDVDSKQDYTLVEGAAIRMREAYKRRLEELKRHPTA